MHTPVSLRSLFLSAAAACALAACGGGSDDSPPPPPPPGVSPTCIALLSGTYRVIAPMMAPAGEYATDLINIDAVTGTTTAVADPTDVGQLTPTGNCSFANGNGGEVVVSAGGVAVFRSMEGGVLRLGMAFREQTIAVADLAGDWQMLGFERGDTDTYAAVAAGATISPTGVFTVTRYCPDVKNCVASIPAMTITLSTHAAGGFNLVNSTDNWTDRAFAYRTGGGDLMMVVLAGNGSFSLWTQQRTNAPPAVGSRSLSWGLWTNASLVSTSAASESDFTTTAIDAAAGSWARASNIDGHSETLFANNPHPGHSFRAEGTALATTGPTAGTNVAVREFVALNLRGTGITALSLPTIGGGAYFLSVTTP